MGVSVRPCVFYGVKIAGYDEEFVEAYEHMYDGDPTKGEFDGMSGEWMVLGRRLYSGGESRYGFEEDDGFVSLNPEMLPFFEAQYRNEFLKKLPEYAHLINKPFQILCFLHYH